MIPDSSAIWQFDSRVPRLKCPDVSPDATGVGNHEAQGAAEQPAAAWEWPEPGPEVCQTGAGGQRLRGHTDSLSLVGDPGQGKFRFDTCRCTASSDRPLGD